MHRRIRWIGMLGILAGLALGIAWGMQALTPNDTPTGYDPEVLGAAVGTADDPLARLTRDQERLRDPQTGRIPEGIHARELAFARTLPTIEQRDGFEKQAVVNNWNVRGPNNQGGRTRALAYDVTNLPTLIAGGVSGGIWRSTDIGLSWTKQTMPGQLHSVTTVVQDPRTGHTNMWFYGTGEWLGNSANGGGAPYRGDGIYRSLDGGLTWNVLPATQSGTPEAFDNDFDYVFNLAVDPTVTTGDPTQLVAATVGGLFYSDDNGDSWNLVLGDGVASGARYESDVVVSSDGVYYATLFNNNGNLNEEGVFRSTNGVDWVEIRAPLAAASRTVLALAPSDETQLYVLYHTPGAGVNDTQLFHYTYVSGDGSGAGGIWRNRTVNIPNGGTWSTDFDPQSGYNLVVGVSPSNPATVFIGGTNLFRSTDGFTSTANTTQIGGYHPNDTTTNNTVDIYPNHHPDQHVLVFYPTGSLLSGHDGGISYTTIPNAANVVWALRNTGYTTAQFNGVALDNGTPGDDQLIGGLQDNGSLFGGNGTNVWQPILGADGGFSMIASGGTDFYPSVQNGGVRRMQLDANGAILNYARIDPCYFNVTFYPPFVMDPSNPVRMYVPDSSRIWRNNDVTQVPWNTTSCSNNGSNGWTRLTNTNAAAGGDISAMDMARSAPRLYFGTSFGRLYVASASPSLDAHETDITGASFPGGAYITSIKVDPRNENNVLVAFSNYNVPSLFYTFDGGSSWFDVSGNLEQNPDGTGNGPSVRWVDMLIDGAETTYFVGTSTGLYSTTTLVAGGTQWAQEGANTIGNVVVEMVRVRQDDANASTDGYVAVATHGNGIYDTFYPSKSVSGFIRDAFGNPISGVVMNGLPGTPVTDAQGFYEVKVGWQWQSTVTPSLAGHTFNPVSVSYSGAPFSSKTGENYTATPTNDEQPVPLAGQELWLKDAGVWANWVSGAAEPVVSQWQDQSSHGRDFLQLVPGRLPVFDDNGFFGLPEIEFDGIDDYLQKTSFSLHDEAEASLFVVFKSDQAQSGAYAFAMPHDLTGLNGFDLRGSSTSARSGLKANGFTSADAVENYTNGKIVSVRYWPPGLLNTHRIYANGRQRDAETNQGPIQAAANRTYLGAFSESFGGYFEGDIAEVLVYSRSLGRAERTAVENYLGHKYRLGWSVAQNPTINSGAEGVFVLGSTGAVVNFTDGASGSGSLTTTTGTNPSQGGVLPPGVTALLPDKYWTIDAALANYTYSITLDLRDFDLSGVSDFADLVLLKREDASSPWQQAQGLGDDVTLVHHKPYLTASGLTSFSQFAIGVAGGPLAIWVNSATDEVDANGGDCAGMTAALLPGANLQISLREAICAANAHPGEDTITLPGGVYRLTHTGASEDANATGDLDVTDDLIINGSGPHLTRLDGNGSDRVVHVMQGRLTMNGVAVRNGAAPGGAVGESGGGIFNEGNLTLTDCALVNNAAGNGSLFGGSGGGLYSDGGTVTMSHCLVEGNTAGAASSGAAGAGGGLWFQNTFTIENTTITNNATQSGSSVRGNGGGVGASASGTLHFVTVAGNSARRGGGIYEGNSGASFKVAASLLADNTADEAGADCHADVISNDYNLLENVAGCSITGTTSHNITGQDPLLGPLQDNGGPTATLLPLGGSPVLDAIPSGILECGGDIATDQRGTTRPTNSDNTGGAACDIGAAEPEFFELLIIVTNLNDSGAGSLRGVLAGISSGSLVTFDPSLSGGTIALSSGEIALEKSVTIDASMLPESITVAGGGGRVFYVPAGVEATLSHLTITGGTASRGGGLRNDGVLTIRSSTITGNEATQHGGGIYNDGMLTLEQVTVAGNRAAQLGGGIVNDVTLVARNSTIAHNEGDPGGDGAGNIYNGGDLSLLSTIVANGIGGDCFDEGALNGVKYSLVEDGTCLPSGGTTNLTGDPLLGAFQDNGGGMKTYVPISNSPVIDQGQCNGFTLDQRGETRPYNDPGTANADDGCDIGAVEWQGVDAIYLTAYVLLEGAFDGAVLRTDLSGHLPETDPYFGQHTVKPGFFTGDPFGQRIVDWVLLQLRTGDPTDAANGGPPMTIVAQRAALLRDDALVVDTDGQSAVPFDVPAGSYYVVLAQRNHLPVMGATMSNCSGGTCSYDFTATAYGTNALKTLIGGKQGLFAGDGDGSGGITTPDQTIWLNQNGSAGYLSGDYNLSGGTTTPDQTIWLQNNGVGSQVPPGKVASPAAHPPPGAVPLSADRR